MKLFAILKGGFTSFFGSVAGWVKTAFQAAKSVVSTAVAKASSLPVVGRVVTATTAAVSKAGSVVKSTAGRLAAVLNKGGVFTSIALSFPMVWRAAGRVFDWTLDAIGWGWDKVCAGATWTRKAVVSTLSHVPGIGETVSSAVDKSGLWVADKVDYGTYYVSTGARVVSSFFSSPATGARSRLAANSYPASSIRSARSSTILASSPARSSSSPPNRTFPPLRKRIPSLCRVETI